MLFNNLKSLRPYRAAARTPAQRAPRTEAERHVQRYATLDFHAQRLYHMQIGLLPYYLRSDDHFSLALPVEQRSPFLDYRIVELGLQLPPSYLFRRGWTKYLLRRAMEPYLPQEVVWRRDKMGFPFPLRPFLREHRDRLAPFASRAAEFLHTPPNYEELLQTDAKKLWRLCATGLWLELD
jgi:asparagine synthase (glutamine-hydrolysing)